MKRKNLLKFVSFLGISSFLTLAAASCTGLTDPDASLKDKKNDPNDGFQEAPAPDPTVPSSAINLSTKATRIIRQMKAKDIIVEGGAGSMPATSLTVDRLKAVLPSDLSDFAPHFTITQRNDQLGTANVSLYLQHNEYSSLRTGTQSWTLEGFKNKNNDIANKIFDNIYDKNVLIGNVNWLTLEQLLAPKESKNFEWTGKVDQKSYLNEFIRLKNPTLNTNLYIEGEVAVNQAPTNADDGSVVVTISAKPGSTSLVVKGDNGVSFSIRGIKANNVRPTEVTLRAWAGSVQSVNNFKDYQDANLVAKSKQENTENVGMAYGADDRTQVKSKYLVEEGDHLGLDIDHRYWKFNPISIPYTFPSLNQYTIQVVTKFGKDGQYIATNAYEYDIYGKSVYWQDYGNNQTQNEQKVNRNTILTEIFTQIGEYRNRIGRFYDANLQEKNFTIDRTLLRSWIKYGDETVSPAFDYSKNVEGQYGTPIFLAGNNQNNYSTNYVANQSNNMMFIIGYKDKRVTSRTMIDTRVTFLNIKYQQK
ncbi:hypothetical protein [Mycoplasma sp. E35C]|uniref:hypothetical protein n=1 Tax=Mycoplasma sp. E35C TaxID=2801918 RepID=UPI0021035166|nr:hypothetical protein [Mycoplasma sp. E35C]